jgi:hypothetical protein
MKVNKLVTLTMSNQEKESLLEEIYFLVHRNEEEEAGISGDLLESVPTIQGLIAALEDDPAVVQSVIGE